MIVAELVLSGGPVTHRGQRCGGVAHPLKIRGSDLSRSCRHLRAGSAHSYRYCLTRQSSVASLHRPDNTPFFTHVNY